MRPPCRRLFLLRSQNPFLSFLQAPACSYFVPITDRVGMEDPQRLALSLWDAVTISGAVPISFQAPASAVPNAARLVQPQVVWALRWQGWFLARVQASVPSPRGTRSCDGL